MNPKAAPLRDLTDSELESRLLEARRQLFTLRLQHYSRKLANYKRLEEVRRDIARIKTILRERELGIG